MCWTRCWMWPLSKVLAYGQYCGPTESSVPASMMVEAVLGGICREHKELVRFGQKTPSSPKTVKQIARRPC